MQLPWVQAPVSNTADQISSVGDFLVEAAKRREEKRRFAAQQLRQKGLDEQQAKLQAAQIANYESEAAQRRAAADEQKQKLHIAAVKDIQASLDAGKIDEAKLKAAAYKEQLGEAPAPVTQQPGNTVMAPTKADLTAPPGPGETNADVMGRNSEAIAANEPLKPKSAGYTIGGVAYNPEQSKAAEQANREETAQRVGTAFDPIGYGPQARALALGDVGKPDEIGQIISKRQTADQSAQDRRDMLDARLSATAAQHERENLTVAQKLSEAEKNRQARIESMKQLGGPRADQANLQAYKYADQIVKEGTKELGLPKLNESLTTIDLALKEMQKPSGAAQIGGRMALERALRGGPPTQYMDQMEATHLGGLWSRLEGIISTAGTGEMSQGQIEAIVHEGEAAKEALSAARDRRLAAIKQRIATEPGLENLHGTANARYRQTAEGMGAKGEDIFPGEGNALPPPGAGSVSSKPKPSVRDQLKAAGAKKKPPDDDKEARKKRLLEELSGG